MHTWPCDRQERTARHCCDTHSERNGRRTRNLGGSWRSAASARRRGVRASQRHSSRESVHRTQLQGYGGRLPGRNGCGSRSARRRSHLEIGRRCSERHWRIRVRVVVECQRRRARSRRQRQEFDVERAIRSHRDIDIDTLRSNATPQGLKVASIGASETYAAYNQRAGAAVAHLNGLRCARDSHERGAELQRRGRYLNYRRRSCSADGDCLWRRHRIVRHRKHRRERS